MEEKENRIIKVNYQLFDITGGTDELVEATQPDQPFTFLSGVGYALDSFEQHVAQLPAGSMFDFTLQPDEAYGQPAKERVLTLERTIFSIDGKFDSEHIFTGALVPLQNQDGNRFLGRVLEVGDDKVTIDLNHPLAGKTLHFKGTVAENRTATEQEMVQWISKMGGEDSDGECHCGHKDKSHCGHHAGGHHADGHCCGHCGSHCDNHQDA